MKKLIFLFLVFTYLLPRAQVCCDARRMARPAGTVAKDSIKFQMDTVSAAAGWVSPLHDPHFNDISLTGGNNNTLTVFVNHNNWSPFSGNSAFPSNGINTAGFFPAAVQRESWYNNDFAFDSTREQIKFGGFRPSATYTVTISGTNNGTGFSDSSVYRLIGPGATIYGPYRLYTGNNTTLGITIPSVSPDVNGFFRFYQNTDVVTPGNHLSFSSGITFKEN